MLDTQHSEQTEYELVVIGAGPGGYVAAIKAAQLGLDVALVEKGDIGGTCLNRGCIPTKTLLHTAELYDEIDRAALFGITVGEPSLDYEALRERKDEVCATLRKGVEQLLSANGVSIIRGSAQVVSPTEARVALTGDMPGRSVSAQANGAVAKSSTEAHGSQEMLLSSGSLSCDSLTLTTKNIIIATGTQAVIPQIEGADLPGVYTSDSLLEKVPELRRLAVIGGGVIGMEFASIYASYGAEVTVLVTSDYALRSLDRELGQSLALEMKKKGNKVIARATLQKIEAVKGAAHQEGDALLLSYTSKDEEHTLEVDGVLLAKGRKADMSSVLSETFTLECSHGKIVVDETMQTSQAGVYAIGDVTNAGPELAHAASAEGIIAASAIAGVSCTKRLDLVPSCIYTSPEIASVGLSEAEAKQAGLQVKTAKFPMAGNSKTYITGQGRSFIKLVANEGEQVVGAQLMCARATDIVGELALGIAARLTVSQMLEIARPHPTFEEAVGEALESLEGTSIHSVPRRR